MVWQADRHISSGAADILDRYFKKIGGRPTSDGRPKDQKKRGRKSGSALESPDPPLKKMKTQVPVRKGRPSRGSMKAEDYTEEKLAWPTVDDSWKPPKVGKDTWEDILLSVEAIHQEEMPKTKESPLWAYVEWAILDDNGKRRTSKVLLESVHKAAPQAVSGHESGKWSTAWLTVYRQSGSTRHICKESNPIWVLPGPLLTDTGRSSITRILRSDNTWRLRPRSCFDGESSKESRYVLGGR